jgi:VWFA-related protein
MRIVMALCAAIAAAPALAQFEESITVARVVVDVRVTDLAGKPVEGLTAADFTAKIGGKAAAIESVAWVDGPSREGIAPIEESDDEPIAARDGALYVVFVQTDFARNHSRIAGQMKFASYADEFIDSLQPEDRVAVFSFDSHLKFRRDFTGDKAIVRQAIRDSLRIDRPPAPPIVHNPALARHLDPEGMRRAATSEAGLLLVADALRQIDGRKTLVLIGWGLGERVGGAVVMHRKWPEVQSALAQARTTLFALDVTEASYHDLELGMAAGAESTGGFMVKTNEFPSQAIKRVQLALEGWYEVELRVPASIEPGSHSLDVRVARRGVEVRTPAAVVIRAN